MIVCLYVVRVLQRVTGRLGAFENLAYTKFLPTSPQLLHLYHYLPKNNRTIVTFSEVSYSSITSLELQTQVRIL
jgi:hypothetical protein